MPGKLELFFFLPFYYIKWQKIGHLNFKGLPLWRQWGYHYQISLRCSPYHKNQMFKSWWEWHHSLPPICPSLRYISLLLGNQLVYKSVNESCVHKIFFPLLKSDILNAFYLQMTADTIQFNKICNFQIGKPKSWGRILTLFLRYPNPNL